jgi:hypothetical protein
MGTARSACRNNNLAASTSNAGVNCRLNRLRIQVDAIAHRAEITNVKAFLP